MKIQTPICIDGYSLLVCRGDGNFYSLSIVDPEAVVHSFEGIYSSPDRAIARGKSVIENLQWRLNSFTGNTINIQA